jgi:hypothetical protein
MEKNIWGPDRSPNGDARIQSYFDSLTTLVAASDSLPPLQLRYPRPGTVFPPEITAPAFTWSDSSSGADFWVIECRPASGPAFYTLTKSPPLPAPVTDSLAVPVGMTMDVPDPNRFRNWRPAPGLWEEMKKKASGSWARLSVFGVNSSRPYRLLSKGTMTFEASPDSVKAPIFYRDVPLMPTKNATGRVLPLSRSAQRLIRWSLRDVSHAEGKVLIESLPTCANCHSFSKQGRFLGLDLDGPQSDKGTYGVTALSRETDITRDEVFSWNYDFKDKPKDKRTIGFLSQVSPDGNFVVTTVNEAVYIENFLNTHYIQVFYPTRGVLAVYSKAAHSIKILPGADDTAFVHCDPTWSPDGKYVVFARAPAKDPYQPGQKDPEYPNDPNETQIKYGLYKIPFNGGRGGKAVPIAGAGDNGMSNTFPKVSPDGKFVAFVKCRNGQLLRPDGRLYMVPFDGGEARLMNCNLEEMNSWHSFSPNGRWMVFSSKGLSTYTEMFLTHIGEDGMDTPPVLIENATAANRAVNLPEFVDRPYDQLDRIDVSAIKHLKSMEEAYDLVENGKPAEAKAKMLQALGEEKRDRRFRSEVQVLLGWIQDSLPDRIAITRQAIASDPENPMAHFNLGVLEETAGKPGEAVKSYLASLRIDPSNTRAMNSLARIYMQSEDPALRNLDGAVAMAEKANRTAKYREPSLIKTLARAYSEAGRYAEAAETARSGLALARQQNLAKEAEALENEIQVYEHGKSFTWALKNMPGN